VWGVGSFPGKTFFGGGRIPKSWSKYGDVDSAEKGKKTDVRRSLLKGGGEKCLLYGGVKKVNGSTKKRKKWPNYRKRGRDMQRRREDTTTQDHMFITNHRAIRDVRKGKSLVGPIRFGVRRGEKGGLRRKSKGDKKTRNGALGSIRVEDSLRRDVRSGAQKNERRDEKTRGG